MSSEQVSVTFQPSGRRVYVLPGSKVLEAAGRAGLPLDTPCGGAGTCGKCRVRFAEGACEPCAEDRAIFPEAELAAGWRLACQSAICGDATIHVPDSSLFADQHQILAERAGETGELLPAVRKVHLQLPRPSLEDDRPDLLRIEGPAGPLRAGLDLLRDLPTRLRACGFAGTAVFTDHHLIDFEPGDTTAHCYGAAFDIGTTTLAGSLLDLRDGRELALASNMNPQIRFGDDVLSRIQKAGSAEGREELRSAIIGAVQDLLAEMCRKASLDREHIYEVVLAGNTTMQHLLCGLDVTPLGAVPFAPACGRGLMVRAAELGVGIHPRGAAYVFPVIGGFVGGDTVSCMLATRLAEQDGPVLLIDIGTNGEIVLAHEGKLWAASTAAGPAFEGARIRQGMRATAGAIEKVVFDGEVRISTIADSEPVGLCGSALVDAAAELLRAGLVTSEGRMRIEGELPAGLSPDIAQRVCVGADGQPEFILAPAGPAGEGVRLTQRDIRELQLASGAIRAGVNILLARVGLKTADLKRVLIAGGFGSFIRRSNAQRIGLLPGDVDRRRIQYVGNASLNGARWALLSTNARKTAERLAREAEHVELSQDMNFQMEFAEAMIFPTG